MSGSIFNGAEIPGAPVVFARMVNPASDGRLVRAMPGYEILHVNAQSGEITRSRDNIAKDSATDDGTSSVP